MGKIINFIRNISPFNNRTEMPKILYVIKVILFFWVCKFGSELVGEVLVLAVHFACGKNPLEGELFDAEVKRDEWRIRSDRYRRDFNELKKRKVCKCPNCGEKVVM